MKIELTEQEIGLLINAANTFVGAAQNHLQAAADMLPLVMKLQSTKQSQATEPPEESPADETA